MTAQKMEKVDEQNIYGHGKRSFAKKHNKKSSHMHAREYKKWLHRLRSNAIEDNGNIDVTLDEEVSDNFHLFNN